MTKPSAPNPILFKQDQPVGLIDGRTPGSINEWNVYLALVKLDLHYFYQFVIDGGSEVRGGQIIDFLVQSAGWVPVFVNGTYWHSERNDPELPIKLAAARQRFNREPVIIKEEESTTPEKALAAVKKALL